MRNYTGFKRRIVFAGVDVPHNCRAFPLLCIVPVLLVAGEGREAGIWGVYVSDLALEGNLYYKTRRETVQRSRRYELKHITCFPICFSA